MMFPSQCYRNILCLCVSLCGLEGGLIAIDFAGTDKNKIMNTGKKTLLAFLKDHSMLWNIQCCSCSLLYLQRIYFGSQLQSLALSFKLCFFPNQFRLWPFFSLSLQLSHGSDLWELNPQDSLSRRVKNDRELAGKHLTLWYFSLFFALAPLPLHS